MLTTLLSRRCKTHSGGRWQCQHTPLWSAPCVLIASFPLLWIPKCKELIILELQNFFWGGSSTQQLAFKKQEGDFPSTNKASWIVKPCCTSYCFCFFRYIFMLKKDPNVAFKIQRISKRQNSTNEFLFLRSVWHCLCISEEKGFVLWCFIPASHSKELKRICSRLLQLYVEQQSHLLEAGSQFSYCLMIFRTPHDR